MRDSGKRIHELSRVLQERVRRQETDDYTSRYLAFSNACVRFVGAVEQGFQRTASFDRMVMTIPRERDEAKEKEKAKVKAAKVAAPPSSGLSDLVSLFGQEMIDAAR